MPKAKKSGKVTIERLVTALKDRVLFTVECKPELDTYVGNCSAVDPETDKKAERWIAEQLRAGNEWAWCFVEVSCAFRGATGRATLGMCSYESVDAFLLDQYYKDLKAEALEDLARQLFEDHQRLKELLP